VWRGRGILLDGHNRHAICEAAGLGYKVVERDFPDRLEAKAWILHNQLGRRNLGDFSRAEIARQLEIVQAEQGKARQAEKLKKGPISSVVTTVVTTGDTKSCDERARAKAAKVAGVSVGTMQRAKVVMDKGAEPLKQLARADAVTVTEAARVAELPIWEQEALADEGAEAVKAKAAELRKPAPKAEPKPAPAPEAPPKLKTKPVETDSNGVPLDLPHLTEAFAVAPAFRSLAARISALTQEYDAIGETPGGAFVRVHSQEWTHMVKQLRYMLDKSAPHAVCPHCGGEKCRVCLNSGYLSQWRYKNVPEDIKAVQLKGVKRAS
jgi:hypothetical protein